MKNSLQKIMNGLIDYAGLFPPAKLPLNEAISEYISHLKEEEKWMKEWALFMPDKSIELNWKYPNLNVVIKVGNVIRIVPIQHLADLYIKEKFI